MLIEEPHGVRGIAHFQVGVLPNERPAPSIGGHIAVRLKRIVRSTAIWVDPVHPGLAVVIVRHDGQAGAACSLL